MSAPPCAPRCLARAAHPTAPAPLPGDAAHPGCRNPVGRRTRPASSGGQGRPGKGRGPLVGPGVPLTSSRLFCGEAVLGKVGPSLAVLQLTPGGWGCVPARGTAGPHSSPDTLRCHEFLGKGPDRRHSSQLERSPAGVGAGGLERNHFPSIEYFRIYYL